MYWLLLAASSELEAWFCLLARVWNRIDLLDLSPRLLSHAHRHLISLSPLDLVHGRVGLVVLHVALVALVTCCNRRVCQMHPMFRSATWVQHPVEHSLPVPLTFESSSASLFVL
jgi:hypothetical protein